MPATAGRVRMPASNRIHSSAALQTHGIWANHIGDSYAPDAAGGAAGGGGGGGGGGGDEGADEGNMFAVQQGLMNLARAQAVQNEASERGSCKKCGGVGHFSWQCRNHLDAGLTSIDSDDSTSSESSSDDEDDDDDDDDEGAARAAVLEARLGGGGGEPAPKRRREEDSPDRDRERERKKSRKEKKKRRK